MYDSRPRPTEGQPIEEVLPAAIGATATSVKDERQKATRASGERARWHQPRRDDEPMMAVMKAGSPALKVAGLSGTYLLAAAVVVVMALIVLAVIVL